MSRAPFSILLSILFIVVERFLRAAAFAQRFGLRLAHFSCQRRFCRVAGSLRYSRSSLTILCWITLRAGGALNAPHMDASLSSTGSFLFVVCAAVMPRNIVAASAYWFLYRHYRLL